MLGVKRMPRPFSESRKPESRRKIAVWRGMRMRLIDSPPDFPGQPCFRGERDGPNPQGWEGEVGGATNRLGGPPHPTPPPRPATALGGGEGRGEVGGKCQARNGGHLTLPVASRRDPSLSPLKGGEGQMVA